MWVAIIISEEERIIFAINQAKTGKEMKKLSKVFLLTCMCFTLLSGFTPINQVKASNKYEYLPIEQLSTIKYEDTLSYEEMLAYMNNNSSTSTKIAEFQENHQSLLESQITGGSTRASITPMGSQIRYSLFYMTTYTYSSCNAQARFSVGLLWYDGDQSPDKIVSLAGEHVYTGGGINCIFSGSIFYQLEAGNRFYYSMYGNLYENGNVNWTAGGSIGIGGSATLNASISNGNGFLANISEAETYYSSGMNP